MRSPRPARRDDAPLWDGAVHSPARRCTAIHGSFDDDAWVERNMYCLNGGRKCVASWEQFCDAVMHEAKHGAPPEEDDLDHDTITIRAMLDEPGNPKRLRVDPDATRGSRHHKVERTAGTRSCESCRGSLASRGRN